MSIIENIEKRIKELRFNINKKKEEKFQLEEEKTKKLNHIKQKYEKLMNEELEVLKKETSIRNEISKKVEDLKMTLNITQSKIKEYRDLTNSRISEAELEISIDEEQLSKIEGNVKDNQVSQLDKELTELKTQMKIIKEKLEENMKRYQSLEDEYKYTMNLMNKEKGKQNQIEIEITQMVNNKKEKIFELEQEMDQFIKNYLERENEYISNENEIKNKMNQYKYELQIQLEENEIIEKQIEKLKESLNFSNIIIDQLQNEQSKILSKCTEIEVTIDLQKNKLEKLERLNQQIDLEKIELEKKKLEQEYKEIEDKYQIDLIQNQKLEYEIESYQLELNTNIQDLNILSFNDLNLKKLKNEFHLLKKEFNQKQKELEIFKIELKSLEEREKRIQKIEIKNIQELEIEMLSLTNKEQNVLLKEKKLKEKVENIQKRIQEKIKEHSELEMNLNKLLREKEIEKKQKIQSIEILEKKMNRIKNEIEEKMKDVQTKESFIEEMKIRIKEIEESLKPKMDIQEKEEDIRLSIDPIGVLRDGVLTLLKRLSENSMKYKARKLEDITSGIFDPTIQYLFDHQIIPSLIQICCHGFLNSWFTPHFYKWFDRVTIDSKLLPLIQKVNESNLSNYDQYLYYFFILLFQHQKLFIFFDSLLKQESLIKYFRQDSILRNTDTTSKIRKLAIIISRSSFLLNRTF